MSIWKWTGAVLLLASLGGASTARAQEPSADGAEAPDASKPEPPPIFEPTGEAATATAPSSTGDPKTAPGRSTEPRLSGPPRVVVEDPSGPARFDPDSPRVTLGLHSGFGGEVEDRSLKPTVGAHARMDAPVWDYLGIAALVQVGAFELGGPDATRNAYIDIDAMPRFRFVVPMGPYFLDLYAGVPAGLTVYVPAAENLEHDTEVGWNVGALGGAQLMLGRIGVLVEAGWIHREWARGRSEDFVMEQAVVNLGLLIRLGT